MRRSEETTTPHLHITSLLGIHSMRANYWVEKDRKEASITLRFLRSLNPRAINFLSSLSSFPFCLFSSLYSTTFLLLPLLCVVFPLLPTLLLLTWLSPLKFSKDTAWNIYAFHAKNNRKNSFFKQIELISFSFFDLYTKIEEKF